MTLYFIDKLSMEFWKYKKAKKKKQQPKIKEKEKKYKHHSHHSNFYLNLNNIINDRNNKQPQIYS